MPLYPAPSGLRLIISRTMPGTNSPHVNVFHFAKRDSTPADYADCEALEDSFVGSNPALSYLYMFYATASQFQYKIETISPEPREGIDGGLLGHGGRTADTEYLPSFCAMKVKWYSGLKSRRFRGRSYFGMQTEADQTAGNWSTALTGFAQDFATEMLLKYGESGGSLDPNFIFCLLSDPDNVLPNTVGGVGQQTPQLCSIKTYGTDAQVYTLRRRMAGVGS